MSSLERDVKECIEAMFSGKVVEKKKRAEQLRSYLDRTDVVDILNKLSQKQSESLSWDIVYQYSHLTLINELNRINQEHRKQNRRTSVYTLEISKNNFVSLVTDVVKKANADVTYIKCRTLIKSVLQVIENKYYKELVGENYINLCYQWILPNQKYWCELYSHWEDLYNNFITIYKESNLSRSNKLLIVNSLALIIKYGCAHSTLALIIKKNCFDFISNVIKDAFNENFTFRSDVLSFALIVCRQLKKECRFAICRFGELNLQSILNLYEDGLSRKKNVLFELLLMIVELHHPYGIEQHSSLSYAYQWEEWENGLIKMYRMIQKEIRALQKYAKMQEVNHIFLQFAVKLIKQVFSYNFKYADSSFSVLNNTAELTEGSVCKKRKFIVGFQNIFDLLKAYVKPEDLYPWLQVLSALLYSYPSMVTEDDYIVLLKYFSECLSSFKHPLITDYIRRCCISLVNIRERIRKSEIDDVLEKTLWKNVWDITLRIVGLNQNTCYNHKLFRSLLPLFLTPSSAVIILKLFLSESVFLSDDSLETLCHLRQSYTFPNNVSEILVWKSLLDWLVPCKEPTQLTDWNFLLSLSTDLLAHMLILVTGKNNIPLANNVKRVEISSEDDDDKFYLLSSFKLNPDNGNLGKRKPVEDFANECKQFVVNEEALKYLLELLRNSCEKLLRFCSGASNEIAAPYLARMIVLMLHIFKYAETYKIILNERIDILVTLMEPLVAIVDSTIKEENFPASISVVKHFRHVLDNMSQVPSVVSNIVSHHSNCFVAVVTVDEFVLKAVNDIRNLEEREDDSRIGESENFYSMPTDVSSLDDRENFITEGFGVLIQFCYHEEKITDDQNTFLKHVLDELNNANLDYSREYVFQMLSHSIRMVSKIENVTEESLSEATITIKNLCTEEEWYKIEDPAIIILQLIRAVGTKAFDLNIQQINENLIKLICHIGCCIANKNSFGPRMISQFIHCVSFFDMKDREFLRSSIDAIQTYNPNVKELNLIGEDLFHYLANPFNEVRFTVIDYIPQVFASFDRIVSDEETKTSDFPAVLQKFCSAACDAYLIQHMSDDEKEDEFFNRPTSLFHCMAYVICRCVHARRPMLYILIKFGHTKNVHSDLIWQVFLLIKDYLHFNDVFDFLRDNISYILWRWYEEFENFQNFPWKYLKHSSETEFYETFLSYTVPILIIYSNEAELNRISELLGTDIETIIKNCFPEIMALLWPHLTNEDGEFELGSEAQRAYLFLTNIIGEDGVKELCMSPLLPDIIVSMISMLQQDEYLLIQGYHVLPAPAKICFRKHQLYEAIESLQKLTSEEDKCLLTYLCEVRTSCVQKIFLQLYINIRQASTVEIRLQRFQMYLFFCELILAYLKEQKNSPLTGFVIRIALHNALSLISADCELTSVASLTFLTYFFAAGLQIDNRVINKYVSFIIGKVMPLTLEKTILGETSVNLMNMLLVDNFERLPAINVLYPFPDSPPFDQIALQFQRMQDNETNLNGKIERFLDSCIDNPHSFGYLQGLKRLRKTLSSSKNELKYMFENLKNARGFLEHSKCILHRLICTLVQLTRNPDNEVKLAAVCCLGEIGLADFHTYVLQPVSVCISNNQPALLLTQEIIELLVDYIIEDNIQIIRAANIALYAVLTSTEGMNLNQMHCLEPDFIYPFIASKNCESVPLMEFFDVEAFVEYVNEDVIWTPELSANVTYELWLTNLTCALLDSFKVNNYITSIRSVCKLKVAFMEHILPYLFSMFVGTGIDTVKQILVRRINSFFMRHFEDCKALNNTNVSPRGSANFNLYRSKSSVQTLLKVIQLLYGKYKLYMNVLDFNFLHISRAAQYCSSYFTSLFYLELWLNHQIKPREIVHDGSLSQAVEAICDTCQEDRNTLLFILREAYSKLGDTDALYGYGASNLVDSDSRIMYYQQVGNWQHIAESSNSKLMYQLQDYNIATTFASSLGSMGLNVLQHIYLTSLTDFNSELQDLSYECSWRLNKWETVELSQNESSFSFYRYSALRNIQEKSNEETLCNIKLARQSLLPLLSETSLEATKNIYPFLSKLQSLQEIEDFVMNENTADIYDKWRIGDETNRSLSFDYLEPIYSQRINMLTGNELSSRFCLETTAIAREDENYHYADVCLTHLKNIPNVPTTIDYKMKLEEAQLLWDKKDSFTARFLLEDFLKTISNAEKSASLHSTAKRIYGCWLLEKNLESVDVVFDKYFIPSIEILERQEMDDDSSSIAEQRIRLTSYKCVSEFADDQYQSISRYINSHEFAEIVKNANEESTVRAVDDKSYGFMRNQKKRDNVEINVIKGKRMKYLSLAMKYYLKILRDNDEEEMSIFRLISLWLENKHDQDSLKNIFTLHSIPTYKIISVLPQIVPHIKNDTKNDATAAIFNPVIERCAVKHPHHTLPLLLALANFYKDEKYCSSMTQKNNDRESRYTAAQCMVNKLKSNQKIAVIVKQMQYLADAYISLAYYEKAAVGKESPIPSSQLMMKIKDYTNLLCPTVTIPISKTCDYLNIVGIHKFKNTCLIPGGVNAPKIITCVCSDGISRKQLVKGKEDLRQDAVMQQVFTNLNKLLLKDKHTNKRNLLIRTYKIVPLSQRSGVIEFCDNTTPLGTYLTGAQSTIHLGAHQRYRRSDMSPGEARKKMDSARPDSKFLVYSEICSKLQPVFRYFFFERFQSPTMWFERKLAYIHSLASSSIIGYILGLGDRHPANILIDERTAELIHIDFGIAFEQGLLLRIAELVPFRLTRDIEDGMGVFGIDGIFRRCCEKTLQVLRQNKNIIKTTIEVFLYDPLYLWTLTPEKAAAVQRSNVVAGCFTPAVPAADNQGFNKVAERALTRIRLKLEGLEEGTTTSIEGQINRLIQQAKDPQNLCKIFHGWQPYL